MKTEVVVARNWDDVVFEKRNKDYGAYFIRRNYEKSMLTGLGISVSLACVLIIVPQIFSSFYSTPFPKKDDTKTEGPVVELGPPPSIEPPAIKPPPPPAAEVQQIRDLPPEVVDHETDATIHTETEIAEASPPTVAGDGPIGSPPVVDVPVAPPTEVISDPVTFAEVMPKSDEMARFISRNLRYPSTAKRLGMQGTVFVTFVVWKDGTIRDVKVLRGFHPDCDKEAVRVISMMPAWSPGMQNHSPVSVRMTLPIRFALQE